MPENPYQSPSVPADSPTPKLIDTRALVRYRRIIFVCVAILVPYYLLLLVLGAAPLMESGPAARAMFGVFTVSVGLGCVALLAAVFSTALLATKLHGPIAGVLLGLVAFYPVVGFLPMAWVLFRSRQMLARAATAADVAGG